MERALVTGGAGFIGSHLVDRLIQEYEVVVLDDLSGGNIEFIKPHFDNKQFTFLEGSIASEEDVKRALDSVTTVYHLAAQPDVRLSVTNPMLDFKTNIVGGVSFLESLRKCDINKIVFASSGGTVYGDSKIIPTPEDTQLSPISNYGAAKSAFEMYLSSYSELYGMSAASLRFANIFGPRLTRGIFFDFFTKLKKDPTRLEVLGTGRQEKAYMYISDTVEAALVVANNLKPGHEPVNVSSGERLSVSRIAELICEGLGLLNAKIEYTGNKHAWIGDVSITDLDITLLKSKGWKPQVSIEEGIQLYIDWLVENYGPIKQPNHD